jgi:hypothetical protein
MKVITRQHRDHERCEDMEVEIIGGPDDGARLILDVVREGPNAIRVLEARYTKAFRELRAAEVEQESGT